MCRGELQFDVFMGYDGIIPQACWFPVVCEIKNDGPTFTGTVDLEPSGLNPGQVRRAVVELPTGTLKRFTIPMFAGARGLSSWNVRLRDERGKVRAEQLDVRPRKQAGIGVPLIGAICRTTGAEPEVKRILPRNTELQPLTARLLPAIFPDNPIVLQGLGLIYLNSEKASELSVGQVNALLNWVRAGGHLVVGLEQPSDVTASPWLKNVFPSEVKEVRRLEDHTELQAWLNEAPWPKTLTRRAVERVPQPVPRSKAPAVLAAAEPVNPFSRLAEDPVFEAAEVPVGVGKIREGRAIISAGEIPLVVTAGLGRGRVTGLMFSPEREPFRSWKNAGAFWARLADVPAQWYLSQDYTQDGGWSSDGIFGAMIDTRQVHKLPLEWLILLLAIYLVVIGPLDRYLVKRLGKPMLTWITFPCYVVGFSFVIYLIGYKMRAGDSEWNELNVVDVVPTGERVLLRGQTYASVYSPSNQRFPVESRQRYATLRGELAGTWSGNQGVERAAVTQVGDNFKAEVFVPVWTSQLLVSDWQEPAVAPIRCEAVGDRAGWRVTVENRTERALSNVQVVLQERIFQLGAVGRDQTKTFTVSAVEGSQLGAFVRDHAGDFPSVVQSRQHAFGASSGGRLDDLPNSAAAASFLPYRPCADSDDPGYSIQNFYTPAGLDLSSCAARGDGVLLAWAGDYSPILPLNKFQPRRLQRNTFWRLVIPREDIKP